MKTLRQSILTALYYSSPQSIAEMSNKIGKSVPNVTNIIQELLAEEIIVTEGLAPSTGGRRAAQYSLNTVLLPSVLAIAIDQYTTSVSLVNLANEPQKALETRSIHLNETDNVQMSYWRWLMIIY